MDTGGRRMTTEEKTVPVYLTKKQWRIVRNLLAAGVDSYHTDLQLKIETTIILTDVKEVLGE